MRELQAIQAERLYTAPSRITPSHGTPRFRLRRTLRGLLALLVAVVLTPGTTDAQIRGREPVRGPRAPLWFSAGAGAVILSDINDGASNTLWRFGADPQWQFRATLEKALDSYTTLGLSASFGKVDARISPLTVNSADTSRTLPEACQTSCAANADLWSLMAQFRSGGGPGFHTLFEANGGGSSFRNFTTAADAIPLTDIRNSIDISGTLGAGFGYALSSDMVLSLVQDFGMGFHSKTELPEGIGRTWRMRTTRAALRFRFGGR